MCCGRRESRSSMPSASPAPNGSNSRTRSSREITQALPYPVFVKPVTLGSSIGIGRADDEKLLRALIDVAANLDRRLLVEGAVTNCIEINCSVMGDDREMSKRRCWSSRFLAKQFLTYEEKYLRGGEGMKSAERIIPAPLSDELTAQIQAMAIKAFRAVDGRGIARIDFLVRPDSGEIFLNELNTMPGSLSFYLWAASGIKPRDYWSIGWSSWRRTPTPKSGAAATTITPT